MKKTNEFEKKTTTVSFSQDPKALKFLSSTNRTLSNFVSTLFEKIGEDVEKVEKGEDVDDGEAVKFLRSQFRMLV
ncbi:MAG: hypothetical protein M0R66_03965 [Candidatus Omnitrophica bacterium]|nr:hypothetical protein [Candidatus Omnitrophota bacterium]